jgi:hypothetical protein
MRQPKVYWLCRSRLQLVLSEENARGSMRLSRHSSYELAALFCELAVPLEGVV